jgi:Uma2 family endonuclease
MTSAAPKLRTFDELYAEIQRLPEHLTAEILEPGVIRTMGRPSRPHRFSARRVLLALGGFDVDAGGSGWWIEVECEIRFGSLLFDPDLAGWRVERVPKVPNENPITIVPDWACEILSPGKGARDDRTIKLPHYCLSGVPWVWLVDPVLHTIEVYEADAKGRAVLAVTAKEADRLTLPPFDGEIDVGAWWLPEEEQAPIAKAAPALATTKPRRARKPKR